MVGLQRILSRLVTDLQSLRQRWALIGGLAVSTRAEPRTTRDIDVAIAAETDSEAEHLIRDLRARGYTIESVLEQETAGRLATARLVAPGEETGGIVVDLLFASSGVEQEVVRCAERLEALPGIVVPVATVRHLLAIKALAGRTKDLVDIESLLQEATTDDINDARSLLRLIHERGYGRGKTLAELLAVLPYPARDDG